MSTSEEPAQRWCTIRGIWCPHATPTGYCTTSACTRQITYKYVNGKQIEEVH